jgi:hypothetical protein
MARKKWPPPRSARSSGGNHRGALHREDAASRTQAQDLTYSANLIKRCRATHAEMEERAEFLIGYAEEHGPVR